MTFDPEAVREFERAGWNRVATNYEASFASVTRLFIPALLDAAAIAPAERLLDIGCGPGLVTAGAAQRGATATGLDFSSAMLAVAAARYPALRFDHGDAEALPYPESCFEVVVSNFGIHHVPRPAFALREALRVLCPGGRLAFTVWAAPTDNVGWKLLFDAIRRHGDAAASRAPPPGGGFSTAAHCEAALATAGYADITTRPHHTIWQQPDAATLVATLEGGTARMAALIAAQDPAVLPTIVADIEAAAAPYRTPEGIGVPTAAIIACGVKR